VNISLPYGSELSAEGGKPWPHVDQSPTRPFRHCVQGIVNLAPNGPADGGLTVLEGSTALFEEYFAGHPELAPATGWSTADTWDHAADAVKWFQDRGCKWTKVCAAPGDLILWDSRTVHYGAAAAGTEPRVATYVCYKPANQISPENLQLKNECFANSWGTSHDPVDFRVTAAHTKTHWKMEAGERVTPRLPPVLSQRARQLAGIEAY
jgi:ectoine hydroxylase-related dioxygenase (phytanoyl-CoA dioxygenase family)